MISYEVWLSQILATCRLISNEVAMHKVWVDGEKGITSIVDFDELYEQLFDDLDSDCIEEELPGLLPENESSRSTLSAFLDAVRNVDNRLSVDSRLQEPRTLLVSTAWAKVVQAANAVIVEFSDGHGRRIRSLDDGPQVNKGPE